MWYGLRVTVLTLCLWATGAAQRHEEERGGTRRNDALDGNHDQRKDDPMKLTTNTQVSVDGVVQGNGGPDEHRGGSVFHFARGGWARPLFDDEALAYVGACYQRAEAFLFGRRTYELFAAYWGVKDNLEDPIVGALNTKPKYVASNTLTDPHWANTTVLSGDSATSRRPSAR